MTYAEYARRMRELPPTIELAARIRDGMALKDLAAELRIEPQGLANRLLAAGFQVTGETEKDYRRRLLRERLATKLRPLWEPWMLDAICAQTDPEAFYPEKGGSTAEAKKVCSGCVSREACLDYALRNGERFGIWGGKSERERRKLAGKAQPSEAAA